MFESITVFKVRKASKTEHLRFKHLQHEPVPRPGDTSTLPVVIIVDWVWILVFF